MEFAKFSLKLFNDLVLSNKEYLDLITGDIYTMKSYYMGLVDNSNKLNFYDGSIRVVDPEGKEFAKFKPSEFILSLSQWCCHAIRHIQPSQRAYPIDTAIRKGNLR